MTHQGLSLRQIAAVLRRATSSISREIRRNTIPVATVPYDAAAAGRQARQRLHQPRCPRKQQPHSAVFIVVTFYRRHRLAASRLVATADSRQTA